MSGILPEAGEKKALTRLPILISFTVKKEKSFFFQSFRSKSTWKKGNARAGGASRAGQDLMELK